MSNCVFCSIIKGDIPASKIYEDEIMVIFKDLEPKAEIHLLAVPKNHYKSLEEMSVNDEINTGKILKKIGELKEALGLGNGYRLIINQGSDAGQTVFHLHIHILGGQELEFADLKNI